MTNLSLDPADPDALHVFAACPQCEHKVHVVLATRTRTARWVCLGCGAFSAAPCVLRDVLGAPGPGRVLVPGASA